MCVAFSGCLGKLIKAAVIGNESRMNVFKTTCQNWPSLYTTAVESKSLTLVGAGQSGRQDAAVRSWVFT